jgi:colicin import membrane protein
MLKSAKSKAEELFTATQKKDQLALKEKEKVQRERADHVAGLRALRLAKEAADKDAAEEADARKAAAKIKKPSRLPRGQQRQS